jgi:hypothetical protein
MREWPTAIELRNRPLILAGDVDGFLATAFSSNPRDQRPSPSEAAKQAVISHLRKLEKRRSSIGVRSNGVSEKDSSQSERLTKSAKDAAKNMKLGR